jgi:hypothetical protein
MQILFFVHDILLCVLFLLLLIECSALTRRAFGGWKISSLLLIGSYITSCIGILINKTIFYSYYYLCTRVTPLSVLFAPSTRGVLMPEGHTTVDLLLLSMQEGHASVCAVCPQHTGCTHADATADSCDSQSHGCVERRQSSAAAKAAH